jgi:hypothetical protein
MVYSFNKKLSAKLRAKLRVTRKIFRMREKSPDDIMRELL